MPVADDDLIMLIAHSLDDDPLPPLDVDLGVLQAHRTANRRIRVLMPALAAGSVLALVGAAALVGSHRPARPAMSGIGAPYFQDIGAHAGPSAAPSEIGTRAVAPCLSIGRASTTVDCDPFAVAGIGVTAGRVGRTITLSWRYPASTVTGERQSVRVVVVGPGIASATLPDATARWPGQVAERSATGSTAHGATVQLSFVPQQPGVYRVWAAVTPRPQSEITTSSPWLAIGELDVS
jgi:hypothetical protein